MKLMQKAVAWAGDRSWVLPLLVMTATAAAQSDEFNPPKVTDSPEAPTILIGIGLVLLVGVLIFAATLKPKRGHLD